MSKKLSLLTLTAILITLFSSTVSFGIMEGLSTEFLTSSSDIVIDGNVDKIKSFWNKNRTSIFTRVIITSTSVIKGGQSQQEVVVEHEGGEVGSMGYRVSDVAPFRNGERVILFLKSDKSKNAGSAFHIVGKGQGKYTVGSDGVARKRGFSILHGNELIDNNIDVNLLINKIRKAK